MNPLNPNNPQTVFPEPGGQEEQKPTRSINQPVVIGLGNLIISTIGACCAIGLFVWSIVGDVKSDLKADIRTLRSELRTDIKEVRDDMKRLNYEVGQMSGLLQNKKTSNIDSIQEKSTALNISKDKQQSQNFP